MIVAFFAILAIFLPWPWSLVAVLAGIAGELGVIVWGRRLARRPAPLGVAALLGEHGRVVEACRPHGIIRCDGELWEAMCFGGAAVGESVVVVGGRELTLEVERRDVPSSQLEDVPEPSSRLA